VFNLVKHRFWFLGISLLVIIPGIISLIFNGLNLSTDFTGGSRITLRPQTNFKSSDEVEKLLNNRFKLKSLQVVLGNDPKLPTYSTVWIRLHTPVGANVDKALKAVLDAKYAGSSLNYTTTNLSNAIIYQVSGLKQDPKDLHKEDLQKEVQQKLTELTTATPQPTATATAQGPKPVTTTEVQIEDIKAGKSTQTVEITTFTQIDSSDTGNKAHVPFPQIQQAILDQDGPYLTITSASQVGAAVANQTTQNAILAVIVASLFILLYIWFSFRKVPKALRYAFSAIIALLHDVLVLLGVFSILGKYLGIQIDQLFITALLTVVGFSVHDTIVVFDRIRENMQRRTTENFEEVVNASLIQTMARSLNTSLTVLFTLLTLTLFTTGNISVHNFTLALLIGISSGTYSSIFNASMILVIWEKGEIGFKYLGGGNQEQVHTRRETRKREMAGTR
jgi:preprotein translocase SecF subunit